MRRSAGFTLLELLLAISLSALLLSVLAYASSTISTQWNRQNDLLQDDKSRLSTCFDWRSLQGMYPYTYGVGRPSLVSAGKGSERFPYWVKHLSPGRMGHAECLAPRKQRRNTTGQGTTGRRFLRGDDELGQTGKGAGFAAIKYAMPPSRGSTKGRSGSISGPLNEGRTAKGAA